MHKSRSGRRRILMVGLASLGAVPGKGERGKAYVRNAIS